MLATALAARRRRRPLRPLRRRAGRAPALAALLLLAVACPGRPARVEAPRLVETEASRRFPALRLVPARATWAIAVSRLEQVVQLANDLLVVAGAARDERTLRQAAGGELRSALGLNLLDVAELFEAGVAVDRGAALFSTGVFPTLVLPIADGARLQATLERLLRTTTVRVSERRGRAVTVWSPSPDVSLGIARLDGWLVLHLWDPTHDRDPAWLEEVLDAGPGLAGEPDLAWALERGGEGRDAVGLIRTGPLGDAVRVTDERYGVRRAARCDALDRRTAGVLGRIALFAALDEGSVDGGAVVELSAGARAALDAHTAAPPGARYRALRAEAATSLSVALDLDWIGALGREIGVRDCGTALELVSWLEPWRFGDPFSPLAGRSLFRGYHASLLSVRVGAGGTLDPAGAASLGMTDAGAVLRLLDVLLPATAGTRRRVGDVEVRAVDLSFLDVAASAELALVGSELLVGLGGTILDQLLARESAPPAPAAEGELLAFVLRTDRVPDLGGVLAWLARRRAVGEREAAALARALGAFRQIRFGASRAPDGVRVAGGFELR